jgi:hypothetical protein
MSHYAWPVFFSFSVLVALSKDFIYSGFIPMYFIFNIVIVSGIIFLVSSLVD